MERGALNTAKLAAITAVVVGALSLMAASPAAAGCRPKHSETVLSNPTGRVFTWHTQRFPEDDADGNWAHFACLWTTGRIVHLRPSSIPEGDFWGLWRLDGNFTAYRLEYATCESCDDSRSEVVVVNLFTRRSRSFEPTRDGTGKPVSLVLKGSTGAVAWIARADSGGQEVWRADARGKELLQVGPGITPGSLKLRGSVVSWSKRRVRHWASLV